ARSKAEARGFWVLRSPAFRSGSFTFFQQQNGGPYFVPVKRNPKEILSDEIEYIMVSGVLRERPRDKPSQSLFGALTGDQ
ncbi:MAG: hypothetical protein KC592_07340, partial [Nitrospira sp.]|nr:hypothetical protein [Nitrospira sp.]